eukprot:365048-Chlamydomonas_euryale.AAC.1
MTSPIRRKRSFGARLTGKAHVNAIAGPARRRRQPGLCEMLGNKECWCKGSFARALWGSGARAGLVR